MQQGKKERNTEWVSSGWVGRAIGLKGECVVYWHSEECPVKVGSLLFIKSKDGHTYIEHKVAALRMQGRLSILRFEGIDDRTQAELLKGKELLRPADHLPKLPEDQFYCYQILGLRVFTEEGQNLGSIVRIFTAGENDVYEILPEYGKKGDEILLPAIKDVIMSVDLESGRMVVRLMEGMLESDKQ